MKIKLKQLLEKSSNLENVKAAELEKTGEMPNSYELVWLEEDGTEIVEKKKTFKDKEKFDEFCCELEENPNFLQINKSIVPSKVESVDQPSDDYKEIKEHILMENYKRFFGASLMENKPRPHYVIGDNPEIKLYGFELNNANNSLPHINGKFQCEIEVVDGDSQTIYWLVGDDFDYTYEYSGDEIGEYIIYSIPDANSIQFRILDEDENVINSQFSTDIIDQIQGACEELIVTRMNEDDSLGYDEIIATNPRDEYNSDDNI